MLEADLNAIGHTNAAETLYLDLLKKCLTRSFCEQSYSRATGSTNFRRTLYTWIQKLVALRGLELVRVVFLDEQRRAEGRDWPLEAETMVGLKRLENVQYCAADVLRRGVPGDLIETGVWRGGTTIFMRALLKVYGDAERTVWVADSFEGLPKPDLKRYPADAADCHWTVQELAVGLEAVKRNFSKYGLLDERVRFLVGWFHDTLPNAPIDRLALLRVDADMYQSSMDALRCLYPKLSIGGYVIIDDYGAVPACRAAVEDFRAWQGITEEIQGIDWTAVFWQRLR